MEPHTLYKLNNYFILVSNPTILRLFTYEGSTPYEAYKYLSTGLRLLY